MSGKTEYEAELEEKIRNGEAGEAWNPIDGIKGCMYASAYALLVAGHAYALDKTIYPLVKNYDWISNTLVMSTFMMPLVEFIGASIIINKIKNKENKNLEEKIK